jgi:hypothetical protein
MTELKNALDVALPLQAVGVVSTEFVLNFADRLKP